MSALALVKKNHPRPELVYVDYLDELSPEHVQAILQEDEEQIDAILEPWIDDAQWQSIHQVLEETEGELGRELTDEEIEGVRDWLYENDQSNPLTDLLHNTLSMMFFADLGLEIDTDTTPQKILKAIGVRHDHKRRAECLILAESLLANSPYGGSLVLLFSMRPRDLVSLWPIERAVYVVVEQPYFCIMDRANGSGHDELFPITVTLPARLANIQVDVAAPGYSWSKDTCGGLHLPAYEGYASEIKRGIGLKPAVNQALRDKIERESQFDRTWNHGRGHCTPLDMKMSRHKREHLYYDNNFPCGTHCRQCGTFWID